MSFNMKNAVILAALITAAPVASAQLCAPWEVVPTPAPASATHSVIRDIATIAPDHVWGVGSYFNGQVIVPMSMRWDGSGWTFFDVPLFMPTGTSLLWAVKAERPDRIWAAGQQIRRAPDGTVGTHALVVRWNGSSWELIDTPIISGGSGDFIWDIEVAGPNDVWFVGEGFPAPIVAQPSLAMRWNGSSLEVVPTPLVNPLASGFGDGNSLHAIDALTPDDIWAVGAGGDGDSIVGASQILHWDGEEWEHRPGPIPGFWHSLDAVVAIAPDDVWAGGEYFDGAYHGFAIHWDGTSWTQVPVPAIITDFFAYGPNDIYAVGGAVLHWNGTEWRVVETFPGVDGPALTSIDSAGPCGLWTAGRQLVSGRVSNFAARVATRITCAADLNADGLVDFADYLEFLNLYDAGDARADFTADGIVDFPDYLEFLNHYDAGC